jgi:hypothetical protein
MSEIFPGVISPDPRSQGRGGRVGRAEKEEGRKGEGKEGEGRGRERVRLDGIWPPILKRWIHHCY